jgi:RNA polymerase sigma-70 factor (ECF subfamily)
MLSGLLFPRNRKKPVSEAFREGEEWAFNSLHSRYRRPMLRYVSMRLPDAEAAEDVVQEIFMKAYRFRESYRPEYAFSTWLWTIARNTLTDHARKSHRGDEPGASEDVGELPCDKPSPERLLEEVNERRNLRRLLRELTALQRRVIWLRIVHRLSYPEIAARLGLSLSAVKCLAYRAKRVLSESGALCPA